MKYKCIVCEEEKESNDCVLELQISLNEIIEEKLGDYVHSPIYNEKICAICACRIGTIHRKGMEKIKEEEIE